MLTDQLQQQDSLKKGKILLITLFITFSFFFNKNFGPFYPALENSFFISLVYAFISIFGFLWILSFKVNFRIITVILPQLILIISSQILFLDMFFDQTFGRLYETLLMAVLFLVFFLVTHASFLTTNVFAVSSFKKIPLEAVAKTTIYIISSLSVFFATYGFLSSGMSTFSSYLLLLVFLFFAIFFLLSHFYLELSTVFLNSLLIFWSVFLVLSGLVLFGSKIEFVALLTTVVFYYGVGFFVNKREQITVFKIFEYIFVFFLVIFFAFYFSLI